MNIITARKIGAAACKAGHPCSPHIKFVTLCITSKQDTTKMLKAWYNGYSIENCKKVVV